MVLNDIGRPPAALALGGLGLGRRCSGQCAGARVSEYLRLPESFSSSWEPCQVGPGVAGALQRRAMSWYCSSNELRKSSSDLQSTPSSGADCSRQKVLLRRVRRFLSDQSASNTKTIPFPASTMLIYDKIRVHKLSQ
jgi:hypothetical protein